MELEVRLSRTGEQPWGFRLLGGADFDMPLTVVKVIPNSPADQANLRNGDTVIRINGADAASESHDGAKAAVAAATDALELGVVRGLYDPVLDDFDPTYEAIDQEDFDQPSQPTEVFQIKDFDLDSYTDFYQNGSGNVNSRSLSESRGPDRSLTESPFVLPTKPYRPFSTEPTPIPPLEDPIILNSSYHDEFGKLDGLDKFEDAIYGETRFKLPISEQYDPDGTRLKKKKENVDVAEERVSEVKVTSVEERKLLEEKKEVMFMEKVKKEIDLEKIEMTAASIVDETIEKAMTVASEIKKEIDLELHTVTSDVKSDSTEILESKSMMKTEKKKSIKEVNELIAMIDKTTDVIIKESDVSVAKEVAKFESVEKQDMSAVERKLSTKQEIEELIETGTVKNKSQMYAKEVKITEANSQRKSTDETQIERKEIKTRTDVKEVKKVQSNREVKESEFKSENFMKTSESTSKSNESVNKEAKYTTAKLLAEQRAYTIGLQTIPHIKGTVQSSYHYDLLLKTFFIHLTDVMVALSRFILAEPVLSKPLETKQENTEIYKEVTVKKQDTVKKIVEETVANKNKMEKNEVFHEQKVQKDLAKENHVAEVKAKVPAVAELTHARREDIQEYKDFEEKITVNNEITEKKMLSGAEMAQLSEKRSEDLIHKMDGVITEFQVKACLDEEMAMQRERRSRSRSRIEEEVMKESDPLEWLSKVDKKTEAITEVKTSKSMLESNEKNRESRYETTEVKKESKYESEEDNSQECNNTYIAIVESHVYTNKNAILDEMAKTCETTSAESIKECSVAFESSKSMVTENVTIEKETQEERAEVIECQQVSSNQTERITIDDKKTVMQDLQKTLEVETKNLAEVEINETIQPIVELQEDIAEKVDVRVEMKNEMDIQEIQSSEYTGELNVIKEDTLEAAEIIEIEKVKVEDVRISQEVTKINESVLKEETKERSEEMLILNSEFTSFVEAKELTEDVKIEDRSISEISDTKIEIKDECAQLKLAKEEITEISENFEIEQEIEVNVKKSVQINESQNKYQTFVCESSIESSEFIQEASFTAKSVENTETVQQSFTATIEDKKNLTLELKKSDSQSSIKSTIDTPTPSTVPPTPVTDEYVFRLQAPLPKLTGPPIPRSPSPEDEDPNIVKKKLIPRIDTEIIDEIVYDTPLPTPPEDKVAPPVYTKPGLRGGNMRYVFKKKEEILEIERKSSLLASAIDETIKSIEEYKEEVGIDTRTEPIVYNGYAKVIETKVFNLDTEPVNVEQQVIKNTDTVNKIVENRDSVKNNKVLENGSEKIETAEAKMDVNEDDSADISVDGYRPVPFHPDDAPHLERVEIRIPGPTPTIDPGKAFANPDGGIIGTHQGIVGGLEEAVVDEEVAEELGKPGMTEEKIAELISGESEMLREAHVMGLTRVLKSHMHRNDDDSSVDFKKIKPIVESLKDSEVLKALNEEFMRTQEEKKKEERKWTKFLQKPSRPVPKAKFGYYGYTASEEEIEDFNTGPLPWEERALNEPPAPPVEPEEPILVPEEGPEFLEAIDNLPESEVPDLEETGIPLPPEKPAEEPQPELEPEVEEVEETEELDLEAVVEETNDIVVEMEENRIAEQLMRNVEGMFDPNAPLEQQLAQMRAQLAALAQLPGVIQQTLELVTRQLCQITQQDAQQTARKTKAVELETTEAIEESNEDSETIIEDVTEEREETTQNGEVVENGVEHGEEQKQQQHVSSVSAEEIEKMKREEEEILGEQRRIEKQKKELMAELQLDQESRQLKQRPTPRVGKPKPVFGPLTPAERPVVLPGGRKWRKPKDAYNDQFIAETLTAQAELIQGKAMGKTYESVHLPYDERVNFMKYEKPPVSLDHLQNSDVYKLIHNMEAAPARRVDMLTPVISEADYREKCRSMTPSVM